MEIRKSVFSDIEELSSNMRDCDAKECLLFGYTPYEGLLEAFMKTDNCTTVTMENEVVAVYGSYLDPKDDSNGIIWLLGSPNVKICSRSFIRKSKGELKRLSLAYETVSNVLLKTNKVHLRWVKWLGFTIESATSLFNKITYKRVSL